MTTRRLEMRVMNYCNKTLAVAACVLSLFGNGAAWAKEADSLELEITSSPPQYIDWTQLRQIIKTVERARDDAPPQDSAAESAGPGRKGFEGFDGLVQKLYEIADILIRSSGGASRKAGDIVLEAAIQAEHAQTIYNAGSVDLTLENLNDIVRQLAEVDETLAYAGSLVADAEQAAIKSGRHELGHTLGLMASSVQDFPALRRDDREAIGELIVLGRDELVKGRFEAAIGQFGKAIAWGTGGVQFDIDLYEQNLRAALDPVTVGYGYSITSSGWITHADGIGDARTVADAPQVNWTPNKEVQVASVSKPLTAILIIRLLEENGLTPDEPVANYLPGNWTLGAGVDQLTFRNFLTHSTGFKQMGAVGNWNGLKAAFGADVTTTSPWYSNTNYHALRVLAAGLMGIDPVDYPEFEGEILTSSAFILYAKSVYASIGVSLDCAPTQANQTLLYNFPYDGSSGVQTGTYYTLCGPYGFYVTPNELAGIMATARYTENLISAQGRQWMLDGELGLRDGTTEYGKHYSHGGLWSVGGVMESCVIRFPIAVETAITVNNGIPGSPCDVAVNAFTNAWVSN